jgi:hypothetical protein
VISFAIYFDLLVQAIFHLSDYLIFQIHLSLTIALAAVSIRFCDLSTFAVAWADKERTNWGRKCRQNRRYNGYPEAAFC